MSPFPYVITTHGPKGDSERAVATLEEARAAARVEVIEGKGTHVHSHRAIHLPESGGIIGPLPDGTEIQVTPYRWLDLAACANVHWEDTPECRTRVLDGFNARERVA